MARQTIFTSAKFLCLADDLALPEPYVLGLLEYLWRAGYEAGNPVIGNARAVELMAKWPGEQGAFCAAAVRHRFLDEIGPGEFAIHDFWVHAPGYVQSRRRRELEREARGKTLGSLRQDAANARWAKERLKATADASDVQADASESRLHASECNLHPLPTPYTEKTPLTPLGGNEGASESTAGKTKRKATPMPPPPPELDVPEFRAAWEEWLTYRKERRQPITPTGAKRSFAELAKWGPARAVAAIHHTIVKGWQGLVEPKGDLPAQATPRDFAAEERERRERTQRKQEERSGGPLFAPPSATGKESERGL